MKKAIVLSGISGSGKTYARTHQAALKNLPCVDMADVYRDFPELDWQAAYVVMVRQVMALFAKHDIVVVEGYFLPNSVTRGWLTKDLADLRVTIEWYFFSAPLETCVARITKQWADEEVTFLNADRRIKMATRCHKKMQIA